MALTKNSYLDKIEIFDTGNGWSTVQCRRADVISEDGTELSRSYHRYVINPTDDWSSETTDVQAVCNIAHTAHRIAAYNERMTQTVPSDA